MTLSDEDYDRFVLDLEDAKNAANKGYGDEGEGYDFDYMAHMLASKYMIFAEHDGPMTEPPLRPGEF